MERHQCRLADAEHEQRQQDADHHRAGLALEDPAGHEIERAGNRIGPQNGRQQQPDRGQQQHQKIDARADPGLVIALVRDQRVGRDRQQFVEQEQREQIAGKGDAERGEDGNRKAGVERRLARLVVAAHVADRVAGIGDPQRRGDQRKQHAERLDLEADLEPRQYLKRRQGRCQAEKHLVGEHDHNGEQDARRDQRDAFAHVGPAAGKRDQHRRDHRDQQGDGEQIGRIEPVAAHCRHPS